MRHPAQGTLERVDYELSRYHHPLGYQLPCRCSSLAGHRSADTCSASSMLKQVSQIARWRGTAADQYGENLRNAYSPLARHAPDAPLLSSTAAAGAFMQPQLRRHRAAAKMIRSKIYYVSLRIISILHCSSLFLSFMRYIAKISPPVILACVRVHPTPTSRIEVTSRGIPRVRLCD